ncbi:MAG: hypothetical protein CVT89_00975, partial [Candidatus Altiarchaeales archaeon HGW-Altiarchaeales-2]
YIVIDSDAQSPLTIGQTGWVNSTITNIGSKEAIDNIIIHEIPPNMEFISSTFRLFFKDTTDSNLTDITGNITLILGNNESDCKNMITDIHTANYTNPAVVCYYQQYFGALKKTYILINTSTFEGVTTQDEGDKVVFSYRATLLEGDPSGKIFAYTSSKGQYCAPYFEGETRPIEVLAIIEILVPSLTIYKEITPSMVGVGDNITVKVVFYDLSGLNITNLTIKDFSFKNFTYNEDANYTRTGVNITRTITETRNTTTYQIISFSMLNENVNNISDACSECVQKTRVYNATKVYTGTVLTDVIFNYTSAFINKTGTPEYVFRNIPGAIINSTQIGNCTCSNGNNCTGDTNCQQNCGSGTSYTCIYNETRMDYYNYLIFTMKANDTIFPENMTNCVEEGSVLTLRSGNGAPINSTARFCISPQPGNVSLNKTMSQLNFTPNETAWINVTANVSLDFVSPRVEIGDKLPSWFEFTGEAYLYEYNISSKNYDLICNISVNGNNCSTSISDPVISNDYGELRKIVSWTMFNKSSYNYRIQLKVKALAHDFLNNAPNMSEEDTRTNIAFSKIYYPGGGYRYDAASLRGLMIIPPELGVYKTMIPTKSTPYYTNDTITFVATICELSNTSSWYDVEINDIMGPGLEYKDVAKWTYWNGSSYVTSDIFLSNSSVTCPQGFQESSGNCTKLNASYLSNENLSVIYKGTCAYLTFKTTVKEGTLLGSSLKNDVYVNVRMADHTPMKGKATTYPVTEYENLTINKVANTSVAEPGDFVNFTISITNKGNKDIKYLRITDLLPLYFEYQSGTASFNYYKNGSVTPNMTFSLDTNTIFGNVCGTGINAINDSGQLLYWSVWEQIGENFSANDTVKVTFTTKVVTTPCMVSGQQNVTNTGNAYGYVWNDSKNDYDGIYATIRAPWILVIPPAYWCDVKVGNFFIDNSTNEGNIEYIHMSGEVNGISVYNIIHYFKFAPNYTVTNITIEYRNQTGRYFYAIPLYCADILGNSSVGTNVTLSNHTANYSNPNCSALALYSHLKGTSIYTHIFVNFTGNATVCSSSEAWAGDGYMIGCAGGCYNLTQRVPPFPGINLTKHVYASCAEPGDIVNYSITMKLNETTTARSLNIFDAFFFGSNYVPGSTKINVTCGNGNSTIYTGSNYEPVITGAANDVIWWDLNTLDNGCPQCSGCPDNTEPCDYGCEPWKPKVGVNFFGPNSTINVSFRMKINSSVSYPNSDNNENTVPVTFVYITSKGEIAFSATGAFEKLLVCVPNITASKISPYGAEPGDIVNFTIYVNDTSDCECQHVYNTTIVDTFTTIPKTNKEPFIPQKAWINGVEV